MQSDHFRNKVGVCFSLILASGHQKWLRIGHMVGVCFRLILPSGHQKLLQTVKYSVFSLLL
jgi:hypothetical protein